MRNVFFPVVVALQFLTRFPLPQNLTISQQDFARATLAFPLVGVLIGVFLLLLQSLFGGLPLMLQAALLLAAWVLITGNLHLDGLADSADAWVGGQGDVERTLTIMKDPTCGPSAVAAVVLLLLIKFAALVAVLEINPWLLVLAPFAARLLLLPWFMLTPYVRSGGLATVFVEGLNHKLAWLICGVSLVLMLALFGMKAFGVLLAVALFTLVWRRMGLKRIGGITGDTTGAMIEMNEALVLVLVVAFGLS